MIYFAQLPTGSIKIGCSNDVEMRMKQLTSHYGEEPALLHVMDGDRSTEREIHGRFAAHRLGRTEQFRPAPELMAFIGRTLLVGANPDAVEITEGGVTEKRRPRAIQVRASDAWKEWVSKYARIRQLSEADLINQALITMAKIDGIDPPPSR